jgi:hypothetical protein
VERSESVKLLLLSSDYVGSLRKKTLEQDTDHNQGHASFKKIAGKDVLQLLH